MMRRHLALCGGSIVLTALVWWLSPYPLDWLGLGEFDPLDRMCLIFVLLSGAERLLARAE